LVTKPAEWLLNPIAERELAEERRHAQTTRRIGVALAITLSFLPVSCIGGVMGTLPPWLTLPIFLALLGLVFIFSRRNVRTLRYEADRRIALREEFTHIEGWATDLTVLQGAAPTGYDRGVAWFEEDRLFFMGERTSMGLSASQIVGPVRQNWSIEGLRPALVLVLDAHSEGGRVSIGFDNVPLDTGELGGLRATEAFHRALTHWVRDARPVEPGLPPLRPGPGAPSLRHLLNRALATTLFWVGVAGALTALGMTVAWFCIPPVAAFLGVILVNWNGIWVPRLRWRAWRDRRRLERAG
jgi:hypothetical protein